MKNISKVLFLLLVAISFSNAELLNPNNSISPKEVVSIQLSGLQENNLGYKDSGIEQTWNFAHPNNKKFTGPLDNFKRMIKSDSYQMMIDHLSHTITEVGSGDKWAQFEVIILDKNKIYHKFNWQVEKYTDEELGTNNYEEALKSSEDKAHSRLQEIKQSMEGTDMVKAPTYIRDKPIQTHTKYKPNVDTKVVASLKRLLRTFKEKTHEDVSDEGYDLDIGEYINMKSNGYGDCFIEDKDTNGLSIVLSIDGSGSMASHNRMVADMVQTIHESTKGEKEIEIKTIVWSSDRMGNVALQRFNTNDIQYIPYQRGGYTPTHFGISEGSKELAKMNGRRKLLVLITDGFPNYHNNGVKVRNDATASATIKAYKKAIRTTPNIAVVGVGMMQTNTYMKNMFGNKYISCRSMNEVGQFMTTTLRREIVRVMKR